LAQAGPNLLLLVTQTLTFLGHFHLRQRQILPQVYAVRQMIVSARTVAAWSRAKLTPLTSEIQRFSWLRFWQLVPFVVQVTFGEHLLFLGGSAMPDLL
jgi:hypothetical protein